MFYPYLFEEETIASLLVALFSGVPTGIFGIVCYVLSSMALYTIARRREIGKAWLSWVPVFNCWIIGSLSDQYRYVVKGQIKAKRKSLLILNLLKILITICIVIIGVNALFILADTVGHALEFYELHPLFKPALSLLGLALPLAGIGIAVTVIRFMALYDIFMSLDPSNAVLFLVLSILLPVVEPFFLFFNREKDAGMPPRRDAPQNPTWEPENKDYL